jgi:hypothetical protein
LSRLRPEKCVAHAVLYSGANREDQAIFQTSEEGPETSHHLRQYLHINVPVVPRLICGLSCRQLNRLSPLISLTRPCKSRHLRPGEPSTRSSGVIISSGCAVIGPGPRTPPCSHLLQQQASPETCWSRSWRWCLNLIACAALRWFASPRRQQQRLTLAWSAWKSPKTHN